MLHGISMVLRKYSHLHGLLHVQGMQTIFSMVLFYCSKIKMLPKIWLIWQTIWKKFDSSGLLGLCPRCPALAQYTAHSDSPQLLFPGVPYFWNFQIILIYENLLLILKGWFKKYCLKLPYFFFICWPFVLSYWNLFIIKDVKWWIAFFSSFFPL